MQGIVMYQINQDANYLGKVAISRIKTDCAVAVKSLRSDQWGDNYTLSMSEFGTLKCSFNFDIK